MVTGYSYDIWNGKKVIGSYWSDCRLHGRELVVPAVSEFKREFGKRYETIMVPLISRLVYDDGVEYRVRISLDVRRKSKRQLKLIMPT